MPLFDEKGRLELLDIPDTDVRALDKLGSSALEDGDVVRNQPSLIPKASNRFILSQLGKSDLLR